MSAQSTPERRVRLVRVAHCESATDILEGDPVVSVIEEVFDLLGNLVDLCLFGVGGRISAIGGATEHHGDILLSIRSLCKEINDVVVDA